LPACSCLGDDGGLRPLSRNDDRRPHQAGNDRDTKECSCDERNRANIFSPDVDKVWAQVEQLIGIEQMEAVRGLLLDNAIPTEVPA